MNIQLVCRYNFLEAKNANFSFSASSVGSRASEVLSFLTTQRKVRGLKRSKKQVKLYFKICNFLIVFGVQNVLFLSFKLKTCNKKKSVNSPRVALYLRTGEDLSIFSGYTGKYTIDF